MDAPAAPRADAMIFPGNFAVKSKLAVGKFRPERNVARVTSERGGITRAARPTQKKTSAPGNISPDCNPGGWRADGDQRLEKLASHGRSQAAEKPGSPDCGRNRSREAGLRRALPELPRRERRWQGREGRRAFRRAWRFYRRAGDAQAHRRRAFLANYPRAAPDARL
jgi:hypothetical protein